VRRKKMEGWRRNDVRRKQGMKEDKENL